MFNYYIFVNKMIKINYIYVLLKELRKLAIYQK